ncbi:hypothetical protein [Streptomyces sp. NBC_01235]|uniref:hypothetical protein n=1 Tax=Streptomyces sp. NBC_01235 TaxID=2903788 RepID=UPI003FA3AB8C
MIDIPVTMVTEQVKIDGAAGRASIAGLPDLAREFPDHWELRVDGPSMHGVSALVLPVVDPTDGGSAVLGPQIPDEESAVEPVALRIWNGDHAVRLPRHDGGSDGPTGRRADGHDAPRTPRPGPHAVPRRGRPRGGAGHRPTRGDASTR